jgi:acyl-CoA thioesterase YciA
MKSMFLVRSEHMTHQGHLFGGDLMAEIDTIGFCLLREEFGDKALVTRAAEISFERPARLGDVITFVAKIARLGRTSVTVAVTGAVAGRRICAAKLVYVNISKAGKKTPL